MPCYAAAMWWIVLIVAGCFSGSTGSGGPGPGPKVKRLPYAGEAEPPEKIRCGERPHAGCWVEIPAGDVVLGAQADAPEGLAYDPAALPPEGPVTSTRLPGFWIQRTEATVGQFALCVTQGRCDADDVSTGGFSTWKGGVDAKFDQRPITGIPWATAATLCDFLGGRLPTQAEWTRAARGDDARRWPWGDDPGCGLPENRGRSAAGASLDQTAMQRGPTCTAEGPIPVTDVLGESPFGVQGMAGNVWEWTADPWTFGVADDAEGPPDRVLAGGSWTAEMPEDVRVAVRSRGAPDATVFDVGLRCVWGLADAP